MIESKGYLAVLNSIDLVDDLDCTFYFAGAFDIESEQINFEKAISNKENVHYLGVVGGEKKQALLKSVMSLSCQQTILMKGSRYQY